MRDDLRARVSAGTAIFRGERILLLHRTFQSSNPGIWELPGGHAEVGESLPRAARRETREETGYRVELGPLFHAEVFSSLSKRGKLRRTVGVYYHCKARSKSNPALDPEEHNEYAWVALSDLESYPTLPFLDRTIRAAFASRGPAPSSRGMTRYPRLVESRLDPFPVPV